MKIKQVPEDFIVDEIFNLDDFKERDEQKGDFYYFKLTKTNYSQIKALEIIAKAFNTLTKLVHFAGTKDKVGITSQLISVSGIKEANFEKNLEFINSRIKDINLEFLGKFNGRVNLGDNQGNKFIIIVRDLEDKEIKLLENNIPKIETQGVLNYFDSQRFGFANNSHRIGLFILKNDLKSAVFEVLTSLPQNPSENLKLFVDFIINNKNEIIEGNKQIISQAIKLVPNFFKEARLMLSHLHNYKADFPGAFRTIHKKLRTLYINAYQSYIFNETIQKFPNEKDLELITENTLFDNKQIETFILDLLKKDEITLENFNLSHMPELKPESQALREVKVYPKNLKIILEGVDELNEDKKFIKIEFELGSGEYATNIVKQLFQK